LRRSLAACGAIRDQATEILVIDNGSATDETRRVAAAAGVRCIREEKRGLSAARNRAILEAHGEVIAFIDDDCEVTREWIPALLEAFRDARVGCVAGRNLLDANANRVQRTTAQYVSGRGDADRVVHPSDLGSVYTRAIVGSGSNFSVRREAAVAAGGFPETLRSGEEVFLFVRLLRTGHSLAFAHRATVIHRHRERAGQQVSRIAFYGRHTAILFLYLAMLDRRLWLFAFNCAYAAAANVRSAVRWMLRRRFLMAVYSIAQLFGMAAGTATAWLRVPALRRELRTARL